MKNTTETTPQQQAQINAKRYDDWFQSTQKFRVYVEIDDLELTIKTFNVLAVDVSDAYAVASKILNDRLEHYYFAFDIIDVEPIETK